MEREAGKVSMARKLVVAILALLVIAQIMRQAFVRQYVDLAPAQARALWPGHPDLTFKANLIAIAAASAGGRPAPPDLIAEVMERSARAPLATEPFLARGVQAGLNGDRTAAERALKAARKRDPRSLAARYFLADHYLKANQPDAGLRELAALTRLVPDSLPSVAPYYAAFAKGPSGADRIRNLIRTNPEFEGPILSALAGDAANTDLILSLATPRPPSGDVPGWHGLLVQNLVRAGLYDKAKQVWVRLAGAKASPGGGGLIVDPQFSLTPATPPFGWTLNSSASGAAEPQAGGRLQVSYYGRDDAVLANQLLLLKPGRYRLSYNVQRSGDASSLAWRVTCLQGNRSILISAFGKAGDRVTGDFSVPGDCGAQTLELAGTAPEFPGSVDVTISGLSLEAIAP